MHKRENLASPNPAGAFLPLALGPATCAGAPHGETPGSAALLRLSALLAAGGRPCNLARLCNDRLYAYECIADANASPDPNLRRLALDLFRIVRQRDAAGATND